MGREEEGVGREGEGDGSGGRGTFALSERSSDAQLCVIRLAGVLVFIVGEGFTP